MTTSGGGAAVSSPTWASFSRSAAVKYSLVMVAGWPPVARIVAPV